MQREKKRFIKFVNYKGKTSQISDNKTDEIQHDLIKYLVKLKFIDTTNLRTTALIVNFNGCSLIIVKKFTN